jgi:deazaflavin-dependent oxidoreductase (nitroreductase family)
VGLHASWRTGPVADPIIASKGGAPDHPRWYENLLAKPECELQVGAKALSARARVADGDERAQLWEQMRGIYPPYDAYQEATSREIPVVVLDPIG